MPITLKPEVTARNGYLKLVHCSCNDQEIDIDLLDASDDEHVLSIAKFNHEGELVLYHFDEDECGTLKSFGLQTEDGYVKIVKDE